MASNRRPPASGPVRATVALTASAAVIGFVVALLVAATRLSPGLATESLLLGLGVFLARRCPIHLTEKTKTTVATVPLFAAVLLLPAPLAIATVAVAMLVSELMRRTRVVQTVFNTAQVALQVLAGAAVFAPLAGGEALASLDAGRWLAAALTAAVVVYLVGTALVELIVSVQLRRLVLTRFWERWWLSLPQEGLLSLLGLLLALVANQAPVAVLLFPAPAWLVYRSLKTMAAGLAPESTPAPVHLPQLPRAMQLYIVAVVGIAAVAGVAVYLLAPPSWSVNVATLGCLTAVGVFASYRLPVKTAPKRVLVLNGSLLMAAIVALPAPVAILVAGLGIGAGNIYQRRPWFNVSFNAAKEALAVLAAGLVYHALTPVSLRDGGMPGSLFAAVPAAITFFGLSTLLVDGIAAIQSRRSILANWFPSHRHSLLAYGILLPLGVALAPALDRAPWLVVVLLLPAAVVRVLLHTAMQLDAQTDLLLSDLIAAVADRYPDLVHLAEQRAALASAVAAGYGLPGSESRRIGLTARLSAVVDTLIPDGAPDVAGMQASVGEEASARLALLHRLGALPDAGESLVDRRLKYDGSNAAAGPRGAGIPATARILAVCECWLQLTAGENALAPGEALARMLAGAGRSWDPELVGVLARVVRQHAGEPLSQVA